MPYPIRQFDPEDYNRRSQTGPCFICALVVGQPGCAHHMVYEDEHAIAFLDRMPTQFGYVLVAPRAHLEHVTGDFSTEDYISPSKMWFFGSRRQCEPSSTRRDSTYCHSAASRETATSTGT